MRFTKSCVLVATCVLISIADRGLAQTRLPQAERDLAREVFRQLVEIPTTEDDANTIRAAQAIADRLVAAGFPRDDVNVLNPTPRTGALVARMR